MTTVEPSDSRIRLVFVSFELWLGSLLSPVRARCVNLPRDAKVVRAMPCHDRMGRDAVLWLHSPDFDPVPEAGIIPVYNLLFEELRPTDGVMLAMRRDMLTALSEIERKAGALLQWGADVDKVDIGDIAKLARAGIDAASIP